MKSSHDLVCCEKHSYFVLLCYHIGQVTQLESFRDWLSSLCRNNCALASCALDAFLRAQPVSVLDWKPNSTETSEKRKKTSSWWTLRLLLTISIILCDTSQARIMFQKFARQKVFWTFKNAYLGICVRYFFLRNFQRQNCTLQILCRWIRQRCIFLFPQFTCICCIFNCYDLTYFQTAVCVIFYFLFSSFSFVILLFDLINFYFPLFHFSIFLFCFSCCMSTSSQVWVKTCFKRSTLLLGIFRCIVS